MPDKETYTAIDRDITNIVYKTSKELGIIDDDRIYVRLESFINPDTICHDLYQGIKEAYERDNNLEMLLPSNLYKTIGYNSFISGIGTFELKESDTTCGLMKKTSVVSVLCGLSILTIDKFIESVCHPACSITDSLKKDIEKLFNHSFSKAIDCFKKEYPCDKDEEFFAYCFIEVCKAMFIAGYAKEKNEVEKEKKRIEEEKKQKIEEERKKKLEEERKRIEEAEKQKRIEELKKQEAEKERKDPLLEKMYDDLFKAIHHNTSYISPTYLNQYLKNSKYISIKEGFMFDDYRYSDIYNPKISIKYSRRLYVRRIDAKKKYWPRLKYFWIYFLFDIVPSNVVFKKTDFKDDMIIDDALHTEQCIKSIPNPSKYIKIDTKDKYGIWQYLLFTNILTGEHNYIIFSPERFKKDFPKYLTRSYLGYEYNSIMSSIEKIDFYPSIKIKDGIYYLVYYYYVFDRICRKEMRLAFENGLLRCKYNNDTTVCKLSSK